MLPTKNEAVGALAKKERCDDSIIRHLVTSSGAGFVDLADFLKNHFLTQPFVSEQLSIHIHYRFLHNQV